MIGNYGYVYIYMDNDNGMIYCIFIDFHPIYDPI